MGPFFCRASERVKHIRQGLIGTVTWKNLSARPRDRHSPAHLKGASNEPARGAAMTSGPRSPTVCYGALDPPVGGTFHFEILVTAPLAKTCPKMVLSHKGGSLCVKDAFAKKPASLVRPGHAQASAILDDASPRTSSHSGLCDAAARSA